MYSIQLPVTIKNADLTSPVYNFHSYTSKERFNRTNSKSFIAKQINEYYYTTLYYEIYAQV